MSEQITLILLFRCNLISLHIKFMLIQSGVPISLVVRQSFFFQNNPKNLDPIYKIDLDLWDCLGRVKRVLYQIS